MFMCNMLFLLQYGAVVGVIVLLAIGGAIAGYVRRDEVCVCLCVCVCVHTCVSVCPCMCMVYIAL